MIKKQIIMYIVMIIVGMLFNPMNINYSNTCPIYLFTGSLEILYKDNINFYNKLNKDKLTKIKLIIFEDMFHCFELFPKYIEEANIAIKLIADICFKF